MKVAVFGSKPYDKEFLTSAHGSNQIAWSFFDFPLTPETQTSAQGHVAVCAFVNDRLDAPCLEAFAQYGIQLVTLRATGFNNVDLAKAHELNIAVTRVPNYSPNSVAEHAVALLLSLNRKIHLSYARIRSMDFSLNGLIGFDICGKIAGVIGTGNIGKVFAQIMKGFGAHVIASDVMPSSEWAKQEGIRYVSTQELLSKSDIISLHVPLTKETEYLIDESTIQSMKKGAILINTSRGKVVKTSALIQALKSGHLSSAGLDTYEKEAGIFFEDLSGKNFKDEELTMLLSLPNVLVTAHQGFFTQEAMREIARVTVENLIRFKNKSPFLEGTQL